MIRRSVALALLSICVPVAAQAKEEKPPVLFDVLVNSAEFDGTQTFTSKHWGALAEVEFSMPYAVQLDGEVPLEIQEQVGGGSNSPISPGNVLFSSVLNQNIFCGAASSRMLGKAGPCLIDTDGDGRFDMATKAGAMAKHPQGMGISNNYLLGVDFGPRIPLPSPVAYHRVDYCQAPTAKGRLTWQAEFNRKNPGPPTIDFNLEGGNDWAGTGLISEPVKVTYMGAPVTADLNGLRVTVVGIGPKGELIYTISGALKAVPMKLKFLDRNFVYTPIFIYR